MLEVNSFLNHILTPTKWFHLNSTDYSLWFKFVICPWINYHKRCLTTWVAISWEFTLLYWSGIISPTHGNIVCPFFSKTILTKFSIDVLKFLSNMWIFTLFWNVSPPKKKKKEKKKRRIWSNFLQLSVTNMLHQLDA